MKQKRWLKESTGIGVILLSTTIFLSKAESSAFLLDTNVVYIGAPYNQRAPSIAFDGRNYLVVWEDDRLSSGNEPIWTDIYGVRVSPTGRVLEPAGGILISAAAYHQLHPCVAFNGTNYLVVWADLRNSGWSFIYGARIDTSGTVLDTAGIYIAGQIGWGFLWHPAIASDGENWFAAWLDGRNPTGYSIYGARIAPDGTVLDTAGILISLDVGAVPEEEAPAIAFDGTNYLVVWGEANVYGNFAYSDIYCARVTPEGVVLDPTGIPIATGPYHQWQPSVAYDGENYLVVWNDSRGYPYGPPGIYGARVNPNGTVLDPGGFPISVGCDWFRFHPSVAFDGTNYLVVWEDGRSDTSYVVYGVRVSPSGSVIGPEICISIENEHGFAHPEPVIGFDGTNYMVSWMDIRTLWNTGADIRGARVSPSGVLLDSTSILISTATYSQREPSGIFDGTNYLVAWRDNRHGNSIYITGQWAIYGMRVDTTGAVLDTEAIAISSSPTSTHGPSLAHDGTNYFCVWHDCRNWASNRYDIYGARVTPSGTVLDTAGIPISATIYWERYPSLAYDGTNYLCVWHNWGNGSYCKISGARLDPSGNVLDSFDISGLTAIDDPYLPPIAFDGTNYLIIWEDNRNGGIDIYGARVDTSGMLLDTFGLAISTAIGNQENPSVASNGANYLVVWEDYRNGDADIYGARVDTSGMVLDTFPISTAAGSQQNPSVVFDGTDYLVVWQDFRNGNWDIYGVKITPSGSLIDSFIVSNQLGDQVDPNLIRGPGNQILIVYSGFVDYINGKPVNTFRIWGKYYPFVGMEEAKPKIQPVSSNLIIYPNPFREKTEIRFGIYDVGCKMQDTWLKIYDVTGRLIRQWDYETIRLSNRISWDGTDDSGNKVRSGVYFLRLGAGDYQATKKVLLVR